MKHTQFKVNNKNDYLNDCFRIIIILNTYLKTVFFCIVSAPLSTPLPDWPFNQVYLVNFTLLNLVISIHKLLLIVNQLNAVCTRYTKYGVTGGTK